MGQRKVVSHLMRPIGIFAIGTIITQYYAHTFAIGHIIVATCTHWIANEIDIYRTFYVVS